MEFEWGFALNHLWRARDFLSLGSYGACKRLENGLAALANEASRFVGSHFYEGYERFSRGFGLSGSLNPKP